MKGCTSWHKIYRNFLDNNHASYLNTPFTLPLLFPGRALYIPTIATRSPGLQQSTKSSSTMTSTVLGSWPGAEFSGISCIDKVWWSLYLHRPYSVTNKFPFSSWEIIYFSTISWVLKTLLLEKQLIWCYPCGIHRSCGQAHVGCNVTVFTAGKTPSCWAEVNTFDNFWSNKRTYIHWPLNQTRVYRLRLMKQRYELDN